MDCLKLLDDLARHNIALGLLDGKLRVVDPEKNLTDEILDMIRRNKESLISLLSETTSLTASDFPASRLSGEDFASVQRRHPGIAKLYIATPMQVGMLFDGMLDGVGSSYTVQTRCDLEIEDPEVLLRAWKHVVSRHDILRTCFVGLETDQVHQLVESAVDIHMPIIDISGLAEEDQRRKIDRLCAEDNAKGFDFESAPLMRLMLIRLGPSRYHFVWSYHHALMDAWCTPIIFGEVVNAFALHGSGASPQEEAVTPYEQYINWLSRQDHSRALTFWRETLRDIESPTPLVFDKGAPSEDDDRIVTQTLVISADVTERLSSLSKSAHTTPSVLLQAAWGYLLHQYSGESKIVFGITVSGRPAHIPGIERMMGLFINSVPVVINFSQGLTLSNLLKSIHTSSIEKDEYSYVSLADIRGQTAVHKGTPLFDSLLVYQNTPGRRDGGSNEKSSPSLDLAPNSKGRIPLSR